MEQVRIRTAQNVDIAFEAAGLGDRLIAALFDYLILAAYVVGAFIVVGATGFESTALMIVLLLPYLAYFLVCEVFLDGQSVGKRVRGIKVMRLDGERPSLGGYLLRWLLRPIDISLTSGLIGVVCILVTERGQRLGDLAAGTTVVKLRPDVSVTSDTLFRRLDDDYVPTFPEARALSRNDVATAKDVLDAFRADGYARHTRVMGEQLKAALSKKMGVTSELPPPRFLNAVVDDYNHVEGRV